MTDETTPELLPCPFCGDPMVKDCKSGIIRHTLPAREIGKCPIVHEGFTNLARWNTRPTMPSEVTEGGEVITNLLEFHRRILNETRSAWKERQARIEIGGRDASTLLDAALQIEALQAALAHNAAQPDAGLVEAWGRCSLIAYSHQQRDLKVEVANSDDMSVLVRALKGAAK